MSWQEENRKLSELDQIKANEERRFSIGEQDGESCESCKYWKLPKQYTSKDTRFCIRNAPIYRERYILAETDQAIDPSNKHFPVTLYDDWCGDFVKKVIT